MLLLTSACKCVFQREPAPVLVFFYNPASNQKPGILDGSTLAAMGNIVVVTASYRTAALGFLSTGKEKHTDAGK